MTDKKLKPLRLNNKQLNREFDVFQDNFSQNSKLLLSFNVLETKWKQRQQSLFRLQQILLGGGCRLPDFQKRMLKLAPELVKQLFDLRSQIPKEAANVICLLARKNSQNMKKITEILISKTALLKVIFSATRVIADNGHRSVQTILQYVHNKKAI